MRFMICTLALLVSLTANALAQDGRWLRAESPGFVVHSTGSETRLRGATEELEAFDALLRRLTDAPAERSPTRLEIYLFSGPGQYQEAWPNSPSMVRGRYVARVDIIAAYAIFRDTNGLEAQEVLFHEYAHHFMYQHFANVYPAWYVEGFAEFVAATEFENGRIVLGRSSEARAPWLFSGSWLPIEEMIVGMPQGNAEDIARFYAQSWLFTHYLFNTEGAMAKFHAYLRALRLGAAPAAAFQTGFGISPAAMQSELRAYLRGNPNALALTRPVSVASLGIAITRLPASADELLPLSTRVRRGYLADDEKVELLTRIRRLAGARHDSFSTLTLAEAEATIGETSTARTLLEPYVAANPTDVQGHYLIGLSYWREAQEAAETSARDAAYAQARRYFSRAYRVDGNHVPTLYRYADSFSGVSLDAATADNALNALLLARQLAPQISEITFRAASWLISADRPAEAIPMLRVIAYNPHGGEAADRAKDMLSETEAALATASPPAR